MSVCQASNLSVLLAYLKLSSITSAKARNVNDPMLEFYRDTFASQAAKDQPIFDMKKVAATLDGLLEVPADQRIAVEGGL